MDAGVDAGEVDAGPDLSCPSGTDDECLQKLGPEYICDQVQGSDTFDTCILKCRTDDECAHYKQGLRCEEKTGHCIIAQGCTDDTNCRACDPSQPAGCPDLFKDWYCDPNFGKECRCVPENNGTGFPGVCRRVKGVCEECTSDAECGNGPVFDTQGVCVALQGDPNGQLPDGGTRKYCFQKGIVCGCGMKPDPSTGACVPQLGSCNDIGCEEDSDCPFGSVCNTTRCLCEPRCVWNFATQELNPPGCPPGKSCWVDPANLDPNSPFFGAGRCKPPCTDNVQCSIDDPRLVCKAEEVAGGTSLNRCRPDGECMDDLECPEPQMGSIYLGYCDRSEFKCKQDCRIGIDPVTNQPYDDCISGYRCEEDQNGQHICKQLSCVEAGGARLACTTGQLCCGEDRNGDGTAEPCPPSGLESNNCYTAPSPPFCTPCMSHEDCNQVSFNGSPLPSLCMQVSMNTAVCAPATFNDFSVDQNGIARAYKGCPAKYSAVTIKTQCMIDADCGPQGDCGEDLSTTLPDGGHPLTCLCTADGTPNSTAGCPVDPDAGVISYCRFAPAGTPTQCIVSVVCLPSASVIQEDPANGGCGIPL